MAFNIQITFINFTSNVTSINGHEYLRQNDEKSDEMLEN